MTGYGQFCSMARAHEVLGGRWTAAFATMPDPARRPYEAKLRDIKGYHGAPFGETIMQNATEGEIKQTTYSWPRPGTDQPLEKTAFYTKVDDQICGVGFYKE